MLYFCRIGTRASPPRNNCCTFAALCRSERRAAVDRTLAALATDRVAANQLLAALVECEPQRISFLQCWPRTEQQRISFLQRVVTVQIRLLRRSPLNKAFTITPLPNCHRHLAMPRTVPPHPPASGAVVTFPFRCHFPVALALARCASKCASSSSMH